MSSSNVLKAVQTSATKKREILSTLIVDFNLKYLNFSAKTKKTVKMAVNPAEGASPPVFEQIFRNARFAQGTVIQN